jgi:hypothetical protein
LVQYGSQYGTLRNSSYSVDAFYHSENGQRPNNDLEQLVLSAQFKQQITAQDSVYAQLAYSDASSGDVAQYYAQTNFSAGLRLKESQEPNAFLGYHREWSPGIHTLIFAGRLHDYFDAGSAVVSRSSSEAAAPSRRFPPCRNPSCCAIWSLTP